MTTPTAPKPTVHDLCLEFARNATGVERYLLLRLAMTAERTDVAALLNSGVAMVFASGLAPAISRVLDRVCGVTPTTPPPAN